MNKSEIIKSFHNTWYTEANEIEKLISSINEESIIKVFKFISECKGKVVITACGTSAAAAKKIVHSLSVINIPAVFLSPSDAVHGSLGIIKEEDVVIFISKGGNTSEITNYLSNVKAKGATIVGVTENETSQVGANCDILLKIKIDHEPDEFNMLATASTMAVIAVFDAICICLMKYLNFSKETFGLNHPQGAVGDRLLKKS